MKISIVICTYNRAKSLQETLNSFRHLKGAEKINFEIIVIDNNSVDDTGQVVKEFKASYPKEVKYIVEMQPGLPVARNKGIDEATGEIIAFTDDDCLVDENYLTQINTIFKENKDVGFIGGRIKPIWLGDQKPEWIKDKLLGPLAILDYGEDTFVLTKDNEDQSNRLFYGANLAFRKKVFEKIGYFNIHQSFAQDTEICLRLLRENIKGMYVPTIIVNHKVPSDRQTAKYFYQWHYRRGKFREGIDEYSTKLFYPLGIPPWLFLKAFKELIKSLFNSSKYYRIRHRCMSYLFMGMIVNRAQRFFSYQKA